MIIKWFMKCSLKNYFPFRKCWDKGISTVFENTFRGPFTPVTIHSSPRPASHSVWAVNLRSTLTCMSTDWVQTLSQIQELQNPYSSISQTSCQKTVLHKPLLTNTTTANVFLFPLNSSISTMLFPLFTSPILSFYVTLDPSFSLLLFIVVQNSQNITVSSTLTW